MLKVKTIFPILLADVYGTIFGNFRKAANDKNNLSIKVSEAETSCILISTIKENINSNQESIKVRLISCRYGWLIFSRSINTSYYQLSILFALSWHANAISLQKPFRVPCMLNNLFCTLRVFILSK